jgi:hypothetical protein
MTSKESPQGRRILVAVVTGSLGDRIQAWRLWHDPQQAQRLPPHTTLCYWAPVAEPAVIEAQLRHAFCEPVVVHLGGVREFDNDQHTFYVELQQTAALDEARHRLYDGKHLELPPLTDWSWHVTCVRDSSERDLRKLRRTADELCLDAEWRVDTVSYLELRGSRYEELASWDV